MGTKFGFSPDNGDEGQDINLKHPYDSFQNKIVNISYGSESNTGYLRQAEQGVYESFFVLNPYLGRNPKGDSKSIEKDCYMAIPDGYPITIREFEYENLEEIVNEINQANNSNNS